MFRVCLALTMIFMMQSACAGAIGNGDDEDLSQASLIQEQAAICAALPG